jgi:uncharacterized coiled-coil protein SlyX
MSNAEKSGKSTKEEEVKVVKVENNDDDDNDNIETESSSDEGTSWNDVAAAAAQQVIRTPPNETASRGRTQVTPATRGRGGHRGRGRGGVARNQEAFHSTVDAQNKIIAGLNSKVADQNIAIEKLRVNYAALQERFFEVERERDTLVAEKEARVLNKQARKAREIVQKTPTHNEKMNEKQ